jgi:hypothetical protein
VYWSPGISGRVFTGVMTALISHVQIAELLEYHILLERKTKGDRAPIPIAVTRPALFLTGREGDQQQTQNYGLLHLIPSLRLEIRFVIFGLASVKKRIDGVGGDNAIVDR